MADKILTDEQRQQLEADFTFKRGVELEFDPVRGKFDAAHLREVNRRIFQDFPGAGFNDVTPGEYRKPVAEGLDWMKQRGLSTVDGPLYVAYSRMDDDAIARIDTALAKAKPEDLRELKTPEFTARFGKLYAELDYVHPFSDGNSRTLRTFTAQLAREAGYDVDWERFNRSDVGRDLLYIARDRSVNELAKPYVQHENTMRKLILTRDRLDGNRDLPDLLRDAIRPSRAVAFEQTKEKEALSEYPELKEAYKTMHAAASYFAAKIPGDVKAQEQGIQTVMDHVQKRLNSGETTDFTRERVDEKQQKKNPPPQQQRPESEHER